MKKVISLLLALTMTVSLVACSSASAPAEEAPAATEEAAATEESADVDYKIGNGRFADTALTRSYSYDLTDSDGCTLALGLRCFCLAFFDYDCDILLRCGE